MSLNPGAPGIEAEPATSRVPAWLLALRWPFSHLALDLIWGVFSAINLIAIYRFAYWETVPFHFIWISLTLLYGFRSWPTRPTMWILGAVMLTTGFGIGLDIWRGSEPREELTEVPLMAAVFVATVWHSQRKLAAERSRRLIGEHNARLLTDQRQFLQDAAHQLRTPITIALGHAELLATDLAGEQQGEDIGVVIGELSRLRRISDRLLLIAAAGDPAFLHAENVQLDELITDHVRRWRPTIGQRLRIGTLDAVTVRADRERLGLALDALIENAVLHTGSDGDIRLSVTRDYSGTSVKIVVADGGAGIPADQVPLIFDRFRTGDGGRSRGTGLGLPLVRAVAHAHGGDVVVQSAHGAGSEFELILPVPVRSVLPVAPADRAPGAPRQEDQGSARR